MAPEGQVGQKEMKCILKFEKYFHMSQCYSGERCGPWASCLKCNKNKNEWNTTSKTLNNNFTPFYVLSFHSYKFIDLCCVFAKYVKLLHVLDYSILF
jgi:hypothetical protein